MDLEHAERAIARLFPSYRDLVTHLAKALIYPHHLDTMRPKIADEMNRIEDEDEKRRKRRNRHKALASPAQIDLARAMAKNRVPATAIGETLGLHPNTVRYWTEKEE